MSFHEHVARKPPVHEMQCKLRMFARPDLSIRPGDSPTRHDTDKQQSGSSTHPDKDQRNESLIYLPDQEALQLVERPWDISDCVIAIH